MFNQAILLVLSATHIQSAKSGKKLLRAVLNKTKHHYKL